MAELRFSELMTKAALQETQFDWAGAADSYESALLLTSEKDLRARSDVLEKISFAKYRTARQADAQGDFDLQMRAAMSCYERTVRNLSSSQDSEARLRILRCEAMMALIKAWLTPEASEKRRLVNNSWRLGLETMKSFQQAGMPLEHWRTLSQLNLSNVLSDALETRCATRVALAKEALEQSELAIENMSNDPHSNNNPGPNVSAFHYIENLRDLINPEELGDYDSRGRALWRNALAVSERSALIELASFGWPSLDFEDIDNSISLWKRALDYASETRDHFIIGKVFDNLAYLTRQKGVVADNPNNGKLLLTEGLEFAKRAKYQYDLVLFKSHNSVGWVGAAEANHFFVTARYFATSREETLSLLRKALELCPDFLRLAEETGYPEVIAYAHHVYGGTLNLLGRAETSVEKKRSLLEGALEHRDKSKTIIDEVQTHHYWNRGVMHIAAAELRTVLADLIAGEEKRKILVEAVRESEEAAKFCEKQVELWSARGSIQQQSTLGMIQDSLGDQLIRLFQLTGGNAYLKNAVDAYLRASEHYRKLGITSRSAESQWKAASGYGSLGEHLKASDEFAKASEDYRDAASRFSPLKSFYQDYSTYMLAWSEIQKAKHHHTRSEFDVAKDCYEETARLHRSSQRWNYLETNYLAWARLEGAEKASKDGKSDSAAKLIEEASGLFKQAKHALLKQVGTLEGEERQLANDLAKAADQRIEYCKARISLEEARVLDKAGKSVSASAKFRDASEIFQNLAKSSTSDMERNEMKLAETLSKAWQMMTWGEAEASPRMFGRASSLFEEAKTFSSDETVKTITVGHSHFCRGLQAGTQFVSTLNPKHHDSAQKYLESAVNCYARAGLQKASEQARATRMLFDASLLVHEAGRRRDPAKKLKSYAVAERLLQASADSYSKADQPTKREEVKRLLERVRREREVAISLREATSSPGIASVALNLRALSPTYERPVGVERFDDATIQATVLAPKSEIRVGEEFELQMEIVNAGNRTAQLISIEGVIPETLELKAQPSFYRVEGSALNPEGRRLAPLKTETVRLVLRPTYQGTVHLHPRVVYVTESGRQLSSSPEPVELMIGAGLPSSRKISTVSGAPPNLVFETSEAERVFSFLLKEFSRDYKERRLYIDRAGWRSFMDLVRRLGLPKRALYGEGGRDGRVIRELERRSFIEVRIFPLERGRGGEVKKVRVACNSAAVKRYLES